MKIFLYGTLKSGFVNHHIIKRIIGEQTPIKVITAEKYPMYNGDSYFPYLEDQVGVGYNIIGEMVEITNQKDIDFLDTFEGVPYLYKRGTIKVKNEKDEFVCECYFRAKETEVLIENLIEEFKG